MAPGQTLLMFTDGLVERPGELLDAGLARLAARRRRRRRAARSASATACSRGWCPPGGASDDVALLALHSPPLTNRFHLELPAEPDKLASMRALLHRWLRHVEASDLDIAQITTATGEAAANAIEHGRARPRRAPSQSSGSAEGGEVAISVHDSGNWRPERSDGRGRGLVLMRAMMDGVEIEPGAGGDDACGCSRRLGSGARGG